MRKTNEGAKAYEHSLDHAVEFFSKAGSLFEGRQSYYGQEESALGLFQKTFIVDPEISTKLLFWLRDCRGGAGNRSGFRSCANWLAKNDPEWLVLNLDLIPTYGRWDDLKSLFGTPVEREAVQLWASRILEGDVLAAKWADRKDIPLYLHLKRQKGKFNMGDFRRLLANIRKDHIVETKMCRHSWSKIDYEKVPSVAMARYTNAFRKWDEERFNEFKEAIVKGEAKIKASVLFPHDCVRTVRYGDREIADAQFEALPNYFEGVDERIIVISDTSGSMGISVSGSVQAMDVSQGMALYCSAKIPEDNPFHKKFIGFCSEGKFKDWNGMKFSEAVRDRNIFDHAIGSTQIAKALRLIFKTGKFFNLGDEHMPTTLLIVSDMQFHDGTKGSGSEVENVMKEWEQAGYSRPKVVYWNTAGYGGQQATVADRNVGLVSGFSPGVAKAIFAGEDFSPQGIMMKAIEKYNINVPSKVELTQ